MAVEEVDTIVIGAGQAGIAMSEHLTECGVPHLVLERQRFAVDLRQRVHCGAGIHRPGRIGSDELRLWRYDRAMHYRFARTLERSHYDVEFHSWGTMLLLFAAIVLVAHGLKFAFLYTRQSGWLIGSTQVFEFLAMGLVFWRFRYKRLLPTNAAERQLWSIWIGYLTAWLPDLRRKDPFQMPDAGFWQVQARRRYYIEAAAEP